MNEKEKNSRSQKFNDQWRKESIEFNSGLRALRNPFFFTKKVARMRVFILTTFLFFHLRLISPQTIYEYRVEIFLKKPNISLAKYCK